MAAMFRASLAETRRSISAWITLGQAISESQITPSIGEISGRRSRKAATRPITGVRAPNKHKLALFRRAGNIGSNKKRKEPMIGLGRIFGVVALLLADRDRPSSINFGTSTGGRHGTAGWQGRGYHRRQSGIGLRTAEIFVAEGANIVIAGRRAPEGEALAKKLGGNCIFRQTDVTVEDEMRALIGQAVEKFGRIDCLFNNAGGPAQTGGIEGLEVARFDAAMATLVRSVMLGMKHAAPYMRRQGSGSIINNGSIAGRLAGFSSSVVYGAAKAAVIHLTKCVAMELGESGVRVNSISPGAIATGIFGKALGLSVDAAERTPAVMREVYKAAQPVPRAGLPEDIAHAAVFLASDESSFINGHDLVVDGAMTCGRNWTPQQQGLAAIRQAFDEAKG